MDSKSIKKLKILSNKLFILLSENMGNAKFIGKFKEEIEPLVISDNTCDIINFQNIDYDNNTLLHIAVKKKDIGWIELLLDYDADKKIVNDDNHTALDLAESSYNRQILSLLSDNKYIKIVKHKVKELNFTDLRNWNNSNQSSHILLIKNVPAEIELHQIIEGSKSFIVMLEVVGSKKPLDVSVIDFDRPMILQIEFKLDKSVVLYVKESDSSQLEEITKNSLITASFDPLLSCTFSLKLILQLLWNGRSLLEIEIQINPTEYINNSRLIAYAIRYNHLVALRFLKLFKWDLTKKIGNDMRALELAAQYGTLQSFHILLDIHNSNLANDRFNLNQQVYYFLHLCDTSERNLIMIAIERERTSENNENGTIQIINFLLQCGLNVNHIDNKNRTASDIAWENSRYEVLIKLLECDAPFPKNIRNNCNIDYPEKLKTIINGRTTLFSKITLSLNNLKACLNESKYATFTNGYNSDNMSLLSAALLTKKFENFSYLKSIGFSSGIDPYYHSIYTNLTENEKTQITKENKKFFINIEEPHIMELLSKTKLKWGGENTSEKFEKIQRFYSYLNNIPETQAILKIVANSEIANIFFDFNTSTITEMDATASLNMMGKTYPYFGSIYVGAGGGDMDVLSVLGTLVHELMHLAMYIIYDNCCKPFLANDSVTKFKFEKILSDCKKIDYDECIIKSVYDANLNPLEHRCAELIVRVPQLIVIYSNDDYKLQAVKEAFRNLFDFYQEITLTDLRRESMLMQYRYEVQKINESFGHCHRFETSKITFKETFNLKNFTSSPITIISATPELVTLKYFQSIKSIVSFQSAFIFATVDEIKDISCRNMIVKSVTSDLGPHLIVTLYNENELDLFNNSIFNIIHEIQNKCTLILPETSNIPFATHISIDWYDLTKESVDDILSRRISFQNEEATLGDILGIEFIMENLTVGDVYGQECLNFGNIYGNSNIDPDAFYIERRFVNQKNVDINDESFFDKSYCTRKAKSSKFNYPSNALNLSTFADEDEFSFDELLMKSKEKRVTIIADVAGIGKSATMICAAKKLKKNNPHNWIQFLDLKHYNECFEEDSGNELNFKRAKHNYLGAEFFSDELLKLNKNRLQKIIWKKLYQNGKVIFLLDGFDEISPNYKRFVMHLIESIKKTTKNQLLISARLNYLNEFEHNDDSLIVKFKRLEDKDQIELFCKHLKMKNNLSDEQQRALAKKLIGKFRSAFKNHKEDFIGIPLQTIMLAEITENNPDFYKDLNFYSLFEKFVDKKIKIWRTEKGELADRENQYILTNPRVNIINAFQNISMHHMFGIKEVENEIIRNALSRIGIIRIGNNGKYEFLHETFSEFFVAQFIFENILQADAAPSENLILILLNVLTTKKFEIIRTFLNSGLEAKQSTLSITDTTSKAISEVINSGEFCQLLEYSAKEAKLNIFKLIFENLKLDATCKRKLLLFRNQYGRAVLHFLFLNDNLELIKYCFDLVENNLEFEERKSIITTCYASMALTTCDRYGTVLHVAQVYKSKEVVDIIFDILNLSGIFTEKERKTMIMDQGFKKRSILHRACMNPNQEVIENIFSRISQILSDEEFANLLTLCDGYGNTILHYAMIFRNDKTVDIIFSYISKKLSFEKQTILLMSRSNHGRNILHEATKNREMEVFQKVLQNLKCILKKEDLQEMLFSQYNRKNTILHCAYDYKHFQIVDVIFDFLVSNFETSQDLIMSRGFQGRTILHAASLNEDANVFKSIARRSEALLEPQQFRELLKSRDDHDSTILHYAYAFKTYKMVDAVFSVYSEILGPIAEKLMIMHKLEKKGHMILHKAIMNEDPRVMQQMLHILNDNLDANDFKLFLKSRHTAGGTILHFASFFKFNMMQSLFDELTKHLSFDELKTIVLSVGTKEKSILHEAITNEDIRVFIFLMKILNQGFSETRTEKLLNNDEFLGLLTRKNKVNTVLNYVCSHRDHNQVKKILDYFRDNFSEEFQKKLFLCEGINGRTIFHEASKNKDEQVIRLIFDRSKLIFRENNDLISFFCSTDEIGNMAIHNANLFESPEIVDVLFDIVEKNFGPENGKKIVISTGYLGRNILHNSATNKCVEVFESVIRRLKLVVKYDFKSFLQTIDQNGSTLLHLGYYKNHNIINILIKLLEDNFDSNEPKKMLMSKRHDKRSVIQEAMLYSSPLVVDTFIQRLKEFGKDEFESILFSRDEHGNTLLHVPTSHVDHNNINLLSDILSNEQLKILFLSVNNKKRSVLMNATLNLNVLLIKSFLMNIRKNNFTSNKEIKDLLFITDDQNYSILHYSVQASPSSADKHFECVIEFMKEYLNRNEQKIILLQKNSKLWNIFYMVIQRKNLTIISGVIEYANSILNREEMLNFLLNTDAGNKKSFEFAKKLNILEKIFNILKNNLDSNTFKEFKTRFDTF